MSCQSTWRCPRKYETSCWSFRRSLLRGLEVGNELPELPARRGAKLRLEAETGKLRLVPWLAGAAGETES